MHYDEEWDHEMLNRIKLGNESDFMIEEFENSHMAYLSTLYGRSADRWGIHFVLSWLMLAFILPVFTFFAVTLIISDVSYQSSYIAFVYDEEEEDFDNLILAFNKMVENMGGDIRFRFETFVMYNKIGYVMWKQDVSPRITDKLFDVSLTPATRFQNIFKDGHNLYEIRDPFKYSRLIIWEGSDVNWNMSRKYNYTYQFKHVKLYRKLIKRIRITLIKRRNLYVSYIKPYVWDACYPLNYGKKVNWQYFRKYYYYDYNSSLFWVDLMDEFKYIYYSDNLSDSVSERKYIFFHYDYVFVLLVFINKNCSEEEVLLLIE